MLNDDVKRYEHEKFKRLCALAASANLSLLELQELQAHLDRCVECHEVLLQYQTLTTMGMITLAEGYEERRGKANWNDAAVRRILLRRVRAEQQGAAEQERFGPFAVGAPSAAKGRVTVRAALLAALAACVVMAVGLGAYWMGAQRAGRMSARASASARPVDSGLQKLSAAKNAADEILAAQGLKLEQLQAESSGKEQELLKLRVALRSLEERATQALSTGAQSTAQAQSLAQALAQQRDNLTAQLQALNQAYESQKAELASLRADRDKNALHAASLEAKIEDLTAANRDQERQLKDAEQYLSSDRDIRELMGARKLYIADVFDVDGSSRTQRPFGRVFYTQGKSLIFYAFDLDREPGVVNASAFQVWGQRETPQGEQAAPMNLGILYRDSESNRRWVMRFDEPKQLAEIDAVFVTVEPRGGSHKPTSKPFLYALLRNEANHP